MQADTILDFWFKELTPPQWWAVELELDAAIRQRFGQYHDAACAGELYVWRQSAQGRLAEIIILDQFSRHIYRGTGAAFHWDGMALALAQEAVSRAADRALPVPWRAFCYLPYMHSESLRIHRQALPLFETPGLESSLRYERLHQEILERFGRYPHRNQALGRESSAEELEFLTQPGSAF